MMRVLMTYLSSTKVITCGFLTRKIIPKLWFSGLLPKVYYLKKLVEVKNTSSYQSNRHVYVKGRNSISGRF